MTLLTVSLLLGMLQRTDGDLRLVLGIWTAGETYRTRVLFRNQTDDFTISMLKSKIMHQLTNEGVKEMYELGLWLRERYITNSPFVSASIQRDETVIESSAQLAALESAEAVVEGLFCGKFARPSSDALQALQRHYQRRKERALEPFVRLTPRAILESDIVNGTTVLQWILQNYRQYMLSLVNSKTKARLT
ncbi:hypothetical protein Q1695_007144 [Nippostrongylus brasiliensis]|nr:hypothetical protein Q1695_007144 [Nippostrongylus brasiliensis]